MKAKTKETLLAHELYSATPHWEMIKSLFSLLVTDPKKDSDDEFGNNYKTEDGLVVGVFDISRANFMPEAQRELYIEIPEEDFGEEDGDVVGRLSSGMYGFRDASNAWMHDWQELLKGGGFSVEVANPALFLSGTWRRLLCAGTGLRGGQGEGDGGEQGKIFSPREG